MCAEFVDAARESAYLDFAAGQFAQRCVAAFAGAGEIQYGGFAYQIKTLPGAMGRVNKGFLVFFINALCRGLVKLTFCQQRLALQQQGRLPQGRLHRLLPLRQQVFHRWLYRVQQQVLGLAVAVLVQVLGLVQAQEHQPKQHQKQSAP
jgi:hypothetical protein